MATEYALIGSSAEAYGHPDECTEPVSGTVQSTGSMSVTNNGTEIATEATADIHFNSHSHDYSGDPATCGDDASHDIDPDQTELSDSVTVNGSPVYLIGSSVTTDPKTGGSVDIIDSGGNSTVTET